MTREQEKVNQWFRKHGWNNKTFFNRPHWTRRDFFSVLGAGVTGSYLTERYARAADIATAGVTTKNTAKNVIFILLAGAPSHTDTFDLKVVSGVTPASFNPDTINGTLFPTGLLPKLATHLGDFALVRSMQSHALVHSLSQTWVQIGRNPTAALGNIAPNVGSVVAIEKDKERKPSQIFPTFLALNSGGGVGPGYLPASYGPFKVQPAAAGIANTTNSTGQTRFTNRLKLMHSLDDNLRTTGANGPEMVDYDDFYSAANQLMYNPVVNQNFGFSTADSLRYGNGTAATTLGNSCLVAAQVLKSQQGTRFIHITSNDGWDMHQNIYAAGTLPAKAQILDNAVSALLTDLKASGMLAETLVVMCGEFGRTVGPLTAAGGRDHLAAAVRLLRFGGGIKGGIYHVGATDAQGRDTVDYGWSQKRYVYPEDIEATIYSAAGIDWTTVRHDDPLGRGFEYVPKTGAFQFYPVHELWG